MDGTLLLSSPLLLLFGIVNSVAWLIMLWDKMESRKSGAERISEGMLFFLATIGGSIGIYLGRFMFRHKTRKWYFLIGIPILMVENWALLMLLSRIDI